jgi:cytochrome c oxidase subunit III
LSDALAAHAGSHGTHDAHHPALQHHFESLEQQHEAATLGMWLFLITEVLFFGGLFLAYTVYRVWYPVAWAEASRELDIVLGALNTAVLIGSSLTMALGVRAAQTGKQRATVVWILLTMALGLVFLIVKYFEYKEKFEHHHVPGPNFMFEGPQAGPAQIYFSLYFLMTGLHATHMIIGFGIMAALAWMAHKGRFSPAWYTPVEIGGLYWHFVDIVWIFLFPLLYLVDRAGHFA